MHLQTCKTYKYPVPKPWFCLLYLTKQCLETTHFSLRLYGIFLRIYDYDLLVQRLYISQLQLKYHLFLIWRQTLVHINMMIPPYNFNKVP